MTVNVNEVYNPEKETETPQQQQQEQQQQECDMKVQMQGECDDTDDRGNADGHDDDAALRVPDRMAVIAIWCSLGVVICFLGGCTLLRWGDNPGGMDNVTPIVTVLKVDMPKVDITFGWSDGTFLLRNGGIVAAVGGGAVTILVGLCVLALIGRSRVDR